MAVIGKQTLAAQLLMKIVFKYWLYSLAKLFSCLVIGSWFHVHFCNINNFIHISEYFQYIANNQTCSYQIPTTCSRLKGFSFTIFPFKCLCVCPCVCVKPCSTVNLLSPQMVPDEQHATQIFHHQPKKVKGIHTQKAELDDTHAHICFYSYIWEHTAFIGIN